MKQKAVLSILITVLLAVPAVFLSGCATGEVVPPFTPQQIKPEPYNPEPSWNEQTDPNILALQQMKQVTGQTLPPSGETPGTTTGGGTTGGGVTPVPGPEPGPAPTPGGRIPLTSDPIHGYVYDRIEGGAIPGATVTLTGSRGETIDSISTDSNGLYSFTSVQSGSSYKVQASASGYFQIPLSYFEFIYPTITPPVNLYLAYTSPFQSLPGASWSSLGYTATPTPTAFYANGVSGHYGDIMTTDFYSASTQKTYRAVLYNYTGTEFGVGICSRGWATYTFILPAPAPNNKYSYDGLWVTLPDCYTVSNNVWGAGGSGTVYYYDWSLSTPPTTNIWVSAGTSQSILQPPWWAVGKDGIYAGQVSVLVLSDQDNLLVPTPWVLTTVKLAYDYHKDTTLPTIGTYYYVSATNELVIQFKENAFITLTDDDDQTKVKLESPYYSVVEEFTENMPVDSSTINVIPVKDHIPLSGNYTLRLIDQAGNVNVYHLTI